MVSGLRDVLMNKNPFSENTINFYPSYQTIYRIQSFMLIVNLKKPSQMQAIILVF